MKFVQDDSLQITHVLLRHMKRIPGIQDCLQHGCYSQAYMEVFTAHLEYRVSFLHVLLIFHTLPLRFILYKHSATLAATYT